VIGVGGLRVRGLGT